MRVLVTGTGGQLGYDVIRELAVRGHEGIASDILPSFQGCSFPEREDGSKGAKPAYYPMDIRDREGVCKTIQEVRPDAVIHCGAWTAVDAAEKEENLDKVLEINGEGTRNMALAAKNVGAKFLYISTDYVFDGQGRTPWNPDCMDFAPLNVYGQSKLMGENYVRSLLEDYFIVRIAWVFGLNGNNFVKTMLRIGKDRDFVTVVDDQIGTPTYTRDLAVLLVDMIESDSYGTYHATNGEVPEGQYISWADFAEEIYRLAGYPTLVRRVSTEEYGLSAAKRPYNSRLDKRKLTENGFSPLPDWKDALKRYMELLRGLDHKGKEYGTD